MVLLFTNAEFLFVGLRLCGFSSVTIDRNGLKRKEGWFKDKYYACPQTVEQLFEEIQDPNKCEAHIRKANPNDLLLALYYLKKYPTKWELAGFNDQSEKTVLMKVNRYVKAIQGLKNRKIRWIFDDPNIEEKFIVSVDGVHFRIWEPRHQPSAGWYSKKFNNAGLAYEVAVALYHNQIVWVNGQFPAGQNDKKIYNKPGGLMEKMVAHGGKGIADNGYKGMQALTTKNQFHSDELNEVMERAKARQETINARLKAFGILGNPFRGTGTKRLQKHKAAFEASCVIIQMELDNGSPLYRI